MREIKFRAWEWGHELTHGIGWASSPMVWKMNYEPKIWGSETVTEGDRVNLNEALNNGGTADYDIEHKSIFMQYTGLKDKNDVEIYEGDIVKDSDEIGRVAYKPVQFWVVSSADERSWLGGWENCEVIGNIYENPDMLR